MTTWRNFQCTYMEQNISSLFLDLPETLMADGGALPLLRPLLPRPSIFLSFSNLHIRRFQNPESSSSRSRLLNFSSSRSIVVKLIPLNRRRFRYKTSAVAEEGRYGRTERGKRRRKRRELWEELFGDNVEDDDGGGGRRVDGNGDVDLWKILEEIVDNVWILKVFSFSTSFCKFDPFFYL